MHIAQVLSWSKGPEYLTVPDPDPTASTGDRVKLRVLAAGLHQVVRFRATGQHYSAPASAQGSGSGSGDGLPHTPGIDCVAVDESTGQLHYVLSMAPGFGTFAEYIVVDKSSSLHPLPLTASGIDAEAFAASVNPAMSSYLALKHRTDFSSLPANYTVLILGVTSASGRLAIRVARALGAGRVVGVARQDLLASSDSSQLLSALKSEGLDEYIQQRDPVTDTDFSTLLKDGVDVVLDYVYGPLAVHLLSTLPVPAPGTQYVMIGALSGALDVPIPHAALRSKNITIRGSGPGSVSFPVIRQEIRSLVELMTAWCATREDEEGGKGKKLLDNVLAIPLKDIETVWGDRELQRKHRLVFVP
ncbi:hypothetical protein F5Y17DRAFT_457147 [Xylariaceae sp. FL0594]|nr:hypothetical protein F5Y17DRAFT_457147 [Xylariaceae sp. FL0594]